MLNKTSPLFLVRLDLHRGASSRCTPEEGAWFYGVTRLPALCARRAVARHGILSGHRGPAVLLKRSSHPGNRISVVEGIRRGSVPMKGSVVK